MVSPFLIKPSVPTDAELRETALLWHGRIGPTLIDQWPADVLALSMPTKFIRLAPELMEPLFDRQGWPSTEIRALAAEMDDAMGWDRHFIRLNSRSPKDAPWPFEVPATCSAKEAIGILACSERVLEDTCLFHFIPEHPAFICLREFIPGLRTDSEFRCFVKNGELIAVTHYDYHNPIPAPKDGGKAIREHIEAWFLSTLRPRLHLQTVVFDVWLDWRGELLLIELNPYGLSDPCWLGGYDAVESFSGFVAFAPVQPDSEPADERSEVTTVFLSEREDGGLRVWSDDEPGLVLSGRDADAVSGDIWRAIKALREYRSSKALDPDDGGLLGPVHSPETRATISSLPAPPGGDGEGDQTRSRDLRATSGAPSGDPNSPAHARPPAKRTP
jgi:hypothetical protein